MYIEELDTLTLVKSPTRISVIFHSCLKRHIRQQIMTHFHFKR